MAFLDDRVRREPGAPFTVLAPVNSAPSQSAAGLLSRGQAVAEAAVLRHLMLDEVMRPEAMLAGGPQVRTTRGGREVTFRIDGNGELCVRTQKTALRTAR